MKANLFHSGEPPAIGERFETLARLRNVHIERVTSSEQPEPTLYVQEQDEWVVLLSGEAVLEVDGQLEALGAGDYLLLRAGVPHRVLRTSHGALWLAVHVHSDAAALP